MPVNSVAENVLGTIGMSAMYKYVTALISMSIKGQYCGLDSLPRKYGKAGVSIQRQDYLLGLCT